MTNIIMSEIREKPALDTIEMKEGDFLWRLRDQLRNAGTAVCIERAKLVTEYMKSVESRSIPMEIKRAEAIRHYMKNREALFHDDNLLAGSTTSKMIGAPVYPEVLEGMSIWPELDTISNRSANPQQLSKNDADTLNFDIYPFWMNRSVLEVTRKRLTKENSPTLKALKVMERMTFFLSGLATVLSHTTPFYEEALEKGLIAMIDEAREEEKALGPLDAADAETRGKIHLYQAMRISMDGILQYAANLAARANELAKKYAGFPEKKKHFQEMARVCRRAPAHPAGSFREAVNALWLCQVGVLAENINMALNPGRLDQVLYPYFKKDAEKGKITVRKALDLIGCLWLKLSDNDNLVPEAAQKLFGGAGTVPAVTLGGVDKDGGDAVNDLTYMMLWVTDHLRLKDPNVNARYYQKVNPEEYLETVAGVIMSTKAIPAIYNDVTNIRTLEKQGLKTEHARDYAVVGCVELASPGRGYSESPGVLMNLPAAMDMTLNGGKRPWATGEWQIGPDTGDPSRFSTWEQFHAAFKEQLACLVNMAVDLNNELGKTMREILPTPLLSCFFRGPWESGKDLIDGGALYNSSGATHIGFADLSDSLSAVKDAVYTNGICTMGEMKDAVGKNFKCYDNLHQYLINHASKYGCVDRHVYSEGFDRNFKEDPMARDVSRDLIKILFDLYQKRVNYRARPDVVGKYMDGKYRPAFWTETLHAALGNLSAALPSGRKEKELFSSGITPVSQIPNFLTTALRSTADLDPNHIPGGYALNMKYTPEGGPCPEKEFLDRFTSVVETYFSPNGKGANVSPDGKEADVSPDGKRGSAGMHIQFNLYSYEHFKEAIENPGDNKWMIVRVSGYSAYFNDLNDAMKQELLTRSQYGLCSGTLVKLN
ncbi:MAG: hypothetical protein GY859_42920 [Desulfobacterales bacterium]|nr:hypothetical protein [Desulfobacterales bacterium]